MLTWPRWPRGNDVGGSGWAGKLSIQGAADGVGVLSYADGGCSPRSGDEESTVKKKTVLTAIMCAAVLAGGAILVFASAGSALLNNGAKQGTNHVARIPNVKVQILEGRDLDDRLALVGTLQPWEDITISSEVAGKVEWKGVDEAQRVKQGQELFRIDTESIQARLDQAVAEARLAEQDFSRAQKLLDRGVNAQRDQEAAVANREVAAASVRALQVQLKKSRVSAPFDGVVAQVYLKQDEFTDVGKPLVRLVQLHKVKVRIGIPERDVTHFKVGDCVGVTVDALPGVEFSGYIHKIAPVADLTTHTFTTEVEIDNGDGVLKPGMIARANLVRQTFPDAIVVPIFATVLLDDQRYVMVERDGIAEVRPVEAGIVQGGTVQITKGVSAGDRLIVVGHKDVRPGERVNVTETLQ